MKNRSRFKSFVLLLALFLILSGVLVQCLLFKESNSEQTTITQANEATPLVKLSDPALRLQWVFNASAYFSGTLWGVAVGDGDGDQQQEIAVVGENGTLICLNGINGSFLWKYYLGAPTYSVDFGDINGDNKEEVITTRLTDPGPNPKYWNITGFDFEEHVPISGGYELSLIEGGKIVGVGAEDLRNQSKNDVLVLNNTGFLYFFDGETNIELDRTFQLKPIAVFNGGDHQRFDINTGDIDGNGVPEFVISGLDRVSGNGSTYLLRWSNEEITRIWKFILNSTAYCSTADFGDVNGDGKEEVIVGSRRNGVISGGEVFMLDGETAQIIWTFTTGSDNVYDISCGDIHNDGTDEVAIAMGGSFQGTYILEGENNTVIWSIPSNYSINGVELADINNDGKCEIITIGNDLVKLYCIDTDGDGQSDMDDLDDDNDGIIDSQERLFGTNQFLIDSDYDNLTDPAELFAYRTNPNYWDTDNDGLSDWKELFVYYTLANNSNSDGDYLSDGDEIALGLDPNDPDSNHDGFPDSWSYFLDDDMDNLTNFQELYIYHTNPFNPDTDYDNLTDWQELFVYYTLANNSNSDGDLLTDWEEIFVYRTNPLDPDSNDDGYLDGATMEAPRYDWIFHLFFALTSVTAILIALNVRYYLHFRRRKALGEATLIRAETIRKTIKDATWFWGHGAQVLKNFDKQIDNNVKIITLEALTRTWTQHYKKSFQTVFKLSDEEATERAETQKKKEIVELYNLLKDKIDIKVIPIAFGKYAGSDSYQFEVGASQSEQIPKPKDTIPIP